MTTLVFGHKSPDTDSTGSPIIWAWYLTEIAGTETKPVLLGEPNTEAAFMLAHWGLEKPAIIDGVDEGQPIVSPKPVSTNGCAPASLRSMIWRRRWPKATRPRATSPAPSGPLGARQSAIFVTAPTSAGLPSKVISPQMPHKAPVSLVCLVCADPKEGGRQGQTEARSWKIARGMVQETAQFGASTTSETVRSAATEQSM